MNESSNLEMASKVLKLNGWTYLLVLALVMSIYLVFRFGVGFYQLDAVMLILVPVFVAMAIVSFWVGNKLLQGRQWAKILSVIIAIISLANVGFGTVVGVLILFYLYKDFQEKSY